MTIDNRTPNLNLPLPHQDNLMRSVDVPRIIAALTAIDAAIATKATPADITAAINALIAGAPGALNTLKELADAIADDANFAATITTQLGLKANFSALAAVALSGQYSDLIGKPATFAPPVATASVLGGVKDGAGVTIAGDGTLNVDIASAAALGGVKVGSGLSIDGLGVLSASGGSGSMFSELMITPTSNGQTVFTPSGGYIVGQIELFHNGVLLYGLGGDYTATNGTTITLTVGAKTTDVLLLRKWAQYAVANVVSKAGDSMTGAFNEAQGADIPSASTINLTAATGNLIDVTGTNAITAITLAAGAQRVVRFTGVLTLTAGASLVLLGSGNIVTAAGDFAIFRGYAGGTVRLINYMRANGTPLADLSVINSIVFS